MRRTACILPISRCINSYHDNFTVHYLCTHCVPGFCAVFNLCRFQFWCPNILSVEVFNGNCLVILIVIGYVRSLHPWFGILLVWKISFFIPLTICVLSLVIIGSEGKVLKRHRQTSLFFFWNFSRDYHYWKHIYF